MNLHELFQTTEFDVKNIIIDDSNLYLQNIWTHLFGESCVNHELSRNCKSIY